jgi:hypothetical protein
MQFFAFVHVIGITVNVASGTYWMAAFYVGPVCGVMGARLLSQQLLDGYGAILILNSIINLSPLLFSVKLWVTMMSIVFILVYFTVFRQMNLFQGLIRRLSRPEVEEAIKRQSCKSKSVIAGDASEGRAMLDQAQVENNSVGSSFQSDQALVGNGKVLVPEQKKDDHPAPAVSPDGPDSF